MYDLRPNAHCEWIHALWTVLIKRDITFVIPHHNDLPLASAQSPF